MTNATNTHSVYVLLIVLPPQQWLHERAPVICYAKIACLVNAYLFVPSVFVHNQSKVYLHCESLSTKFPTTVDQ